MDGPHESLEQTLLKRDLTYATPGEGASLGINQNLRQHAERIQQLLRSPAETRDNKEKIQEIVSADQCRIHDTHKYTEDEILYRISELAHVHRDDLVPARIMRIGSNDGPVCDALYRVENPGPGIVDQYYEFVLHGQYGTSFSNRTALYSFTSTTPDAELLDDIAEEVSDSITGDAPKIVSEETPDEPVAQLQAPQPHEEVEYFKPKALADNQIIDPDTDLLVTADELATVMGGRWVTGYQRINQSGS